MKSEPNSTFGVRRWPATVIGIVFLAVFATLTATRAPAATSVFTKINTSLPNVWYGSVAWGDYDNDGFLDLLITGATGVDGDGFPMNLIAQVWHNNGSGNFSLAYSLPGVCYSSVAWGDFDNDGRLDILLTGITNTATGNSISQVWRNNGNGTFSKVNLSLPGVCYGSAALGDYDNDGRPDILLTGASGTNLIAQVWRNTGSGFANINAGLPGVIYGSATWGDYDNDGRLDILLTGARTNFVFALDDIAQVWRNNGDNTFSNINAGLPGVARSSAAWGDYDNDGRLDILLTGTPDDVSGSSLAQVWHNNGNNTFSLVSNAGLPQVYSDSAAWGDFDNDGRLDILLAGQTGRFPPTSLAQVLRNNGDGSFSNIQAGLPGFSPGSSAWGDYDGDGRMDLLLSGSVGLSTPIPSLQLWQNTGQPSGTPPTVPTTPTGLTAVLTTNGLALSWNPSTDPRAPGSPLTYNLRLATNSGGVGIVCPESALDTGFRRVPATGNLQFQQNVLFTNLSWGLYYWSAQAVNSSFEGSTFAPEERKLAAAMTLPATGVGLTTATLNGAVHPMGKLTTAWFEWGATTAYGNATPVLLTNSGSVPVSLTCQLTGLVFHAYHYRIVATNTLAINVPAVGGDTLIPMVLEPPRVSTLTATNVTATNATLQGTVNPKERDTLAWFEYGLDARYGQSTAGLNISRGTTDVLVTNRLSGLKPWMTYHYRMVGSNNVGRTDGPDLTFTASPPPAVVPWLNGLSDITLPQAGGITVPITVSPGWLDVQVRSSNPVLLPANGLVLGGNGTDRTLDVMPAANYSGTAQVTVTATDGNRSVSQTFNVTVNPSAAQTAGSLYLTNVFLPGAQVVSNQAWRFRLVDVGTGATSYEVDYRSSLAPTNVWVRATNVTALGGGVFEVAIGPPRPRLGFYRVAGFRVIMGGFSTNSYTVQEGAGQAGPVLVFNAVYTGWVTNIWTDQQGVSTTSAIWVNGTTAVIPLAQSYLADNASIGQLRYLTLQLQGGTSLAPGTTTRTRVTIDDNEANWEGALTTPSGTLDFTMTLVQTNSQSTGRLRGQIQSEGFGFFPTNTLVQLNLTEDAFTAIATNIPLPTLTAYPGLGFTNWVDLRLDATNGPGVTNVSPNEIAGTVTLVSKVPGRGYLDAAVSGTFTLLKRITPASTNDVPLYPVQ